MEETVTYDPNEESKHQYNGHESTSFKAKITQNKKLC
jgi:hypothetical protein